MSTRWSNILYGGPFGGDNDIWKSEVFLDTEGGEWIQCTNAECRRRYEVKDDIPVMLIDESTVLEPAAFEAALARRTDSGD